jgi:Ca2+-binding EF-hand superfamily protein
MEAVDPYDAGYALTKYFGADEISEYTRCFKGYDANKDGTLDRNELKTVLVDLGLREITSEQTDDLLKDVDLNND